MGGDRYGREENSISNVFISQHSMSGGYFAHIRDLRRKTDS